MQGSAGIGLATAKGAVPPIYPYWHQQKYGSERIPQSLQ